MEVIYKMEGEGRIAERGNKRGRELKERQVKGQKWAEGRGRKEWEG